MQLGEAGIQTNDPPITRQPALPPELQPPHFTFSIACMHKLIELYLLCYIYIHILKRFYFSSTDLLVQVSWMSVISLIGSVWA